MVPSSVTVATVWIVSMADLLGSHSSSRRAGSPRLRRLLLSLLALEVLAVPGEVALVAILLVRRLRDAVVLAGIDHQLGLAAEPPQRLVELLGVEQRHVDVVRAAEDQRGGGDLLDLEEGGDPRPPLGVLPGQPQLGLPLLLIMVGAVVGEVVDLARP